MDRVERAEARESLTVEFWAIAVPSDIVGAGDTLISSAQWGRKTIGEAVSSISAACGGSLVMLSSVSKSDCKLPSLG